MKIIFQKDYNLPEKETCVFHGEKTCNCGRSQTGLHFQCQLFRPPPPRIEKLGYAASSTAAATKNIPKERYAAESSQAPRLLLSLLFLAEEQGALQLAKTCQCWHTKKPWEGNRRGVDDSQGVKAKKEQLELNALH